MNRAVNKPQSFAQALRAACNYIDMADSLVTMVANSRGETVEISPEMQEDLRRVADRIPTHIDDQLLAMMLDGKQ